MPPNFDSPSDQINKDISLRTGQPFYGSGNPLDPKLFVNEPKSKIQAAMMAKKSESQLMDAVRIMAKLKQREIRRAKFHHKKNKGGKLFASTKAENIVLEHDIRSVSEDAFARVQAQSAMTFMPPQQPNKKKDLNELWKY